MTQKRFKAYVGDADFHDGVIRQVQHELDVLSVEIEGYSGVRYLVRFIGVESVISNKPEGMVLYALSEMEIQPPLREFHFANSYEPNKEGGDSKLRVIARRVLVERL
jgi:hypothetical protein